MNGSNQSTNVLVKCISVDPIHFSGKLNFNFFCFFFFLLIFQCVPLVNLYIPLHKLCVNGAIQWKSFFISSNVWHQIAWIAWIQIEFGTKIGLHNSKRFGNNRLHSVWAKEVSFFCVCICVHGIVFKFKFFYFFLLDKYILVHSRYEGIWVGKCSNIKRTHAYNKQINNGGGMPITLIQKLLQSNALANA